MNLQSNELNIIKIELLVINIINFGYFGYILILFQL
jgi:hypothetical protein